MSAEDVAKALTTALDYIRRGWAPVPVPYRQKGPKLLDWGKLQVDAATAKRYFNGEQQNIGVKLGLWSGGLADVDLDCIQAIRVASAILPATGSIFGHAAKPASHWLYRVGTLDPETGSFHPDRCPSAKYLDPTDRSTLVELRADPSDPDKDAYQTVFPGSVHPTGHPIEWQEDGDAAAIRVALLRKDVARLASVSLVAKHWPTGPHRTPDGGSVSGGRNEANLVVAGWLTRCGMKPGRVAKFLELVTIAAGGSANPAKRASIAKDAAARVEVDGHIYGWPAAVELLGESVVEKVAEWLRLRRTRPNGDAQGGYAAGTRHREGNEDKAEDPSEPHKPEPEPWPEPLDIIGAPDLVGWPTLTADCLPAPLYRYVTAEAARLNVDPCPLAGHVIAACSISISDLFTIKPKLHDHYTQQARVWVCVVKNVGARGTEMLHSAVWPLKEKNSELHKKYAAEKAAWDARQAIKKDKTDPAPKQIRIITSDATVESMSEILKNGSGTSKLGAIYDELVTFLCGFGRYSENGGGNAVRGVMLEAYDGGPHWIDRIKRPNVYVPNWSLAVLGNIQPRRLAVMAPTLVDDGLFQRFLTLHTAPPVLGRDDDRPAPEAPRAAYRDVHATLAQLSPVLDAAGNALPCYFDADARAERQRFMRLVERLQVDPSLPTIIRETAPKWSGLLARLALVFHAVELVEQRNGGSAPSPEDICRVTGTTVTMAANFLRRIALPNLFRLGFETMPEEGAAAGHARWIAEHVLAHSLTDIRARDIGRCCKELRGKSQEIAIAMEVLVDAGWARPTATRRDSLQWEINPAVHLDFAVAAAAEKARRAKVVELIRTKVQSL